MNKQLAILDLSKVGDVLYNEGTVHILSRKGQPVSVIDNVSLDEFNTLVQSVRAKCSNIGNSIVCVLGETELQDEPIEA